MSNIAYNASPTVNIGSPTLQNLETRKDRKSKD